MAFTAPASPALAYRADIDGLRAVAVLGVVAYHAAPGHLPGGFVGVDVFFVISGYLITGILAAQLQAGRFSFGGFYARRIRRIFPALALVLAAVLLAGWWLLLPGELARVARHALAGAGFVANLAYGLESSYFDAIAQTRPLLNLWSLGVEEQFYLLWPLALWLAWRHGGQRALLVLTAGAGLLSFAANVLSVHPAPTLAFYFPHTRLWELLAGAALVLAPRPAALAPSTANALAVLGALALGLGYALIRAGHAFPGFWALLPVVGAVALIGAGPGAWINRRVLAARPLVGCGLISYSLYLWHWPLLALLAEWPAGGGRLARLGAVALAFVLAWLTWRFVEQPLRHGAHLRRKAVGAVAALALMAAAAGALWAAHGVPARFAGAVFLDEAAIRRERLAYWARGSWDRHFDTRRPRVIVFGDSQGFDVFKSLALDGRLGIKNFESSYDCTAFDLPIRGKEDQAAHCRELYQRLPDSGDLARADVFIYTYSWSQADEPAGALAHFQRAVQQIRAANPHIRIVFLGPKPLLGHRWVSINTLVAGQTATTALNAALNRIKWIRQGDIDHARALAKALGVEFLDAAAIYCRGGCTFYEGGQFAYFDQNHWTGLGARLFLEKFKEAGAWQALFGLPP